MSASTSGACVTVVLSPREHTATSPPPNVIDLVVLLSIRRDGDASSILVALQKPTEDPSRLAGLLGISDVFVLVAPPHRSRQ
jgi:hypothetical protein